MDDYLEEINKAISDNQRKKEIYLEGKNILEKIWGIQFGVELLRNDIHDDLYVLVRGLNDLSIDDIDDFKIYNGEAIDDMINNTKEVSNMYISKYMDFKEELDRDFGTYTNIALASNNNGLFLKYDKYIEGILRLWKAKYLGEQNELFPMIRLDEERWIFKKELTLDDFYKDVVVIKSKMFAYDEDEWYKINREEELDEVVVNFNDFIDRISDSELEVYYDGYWEAKYDIPFENIFMGQKNGCLDQRFDLIYEVPLEELEKRNKILLK